MRKAYVIYAVERDYDDEGIFVGYYNVILKVAETEELAKKILQQCLDPYALGPGDKVEIISDGHYGRAMVNGDIWYGFVSVDVVEG